MTIEPVAAQALVLDESPKTTSPLEPGSGAGAEPDTPRRVAMSYEAYMLQDFDGARTEWVDGEAIIYMSASKRHQVLVAFLTKVLGQFVDFTGQGTVLTAPFETRLWEGGPAREPDLCFIAGAHADRLTDERLIGAPDLAVEIVSPGSVAIDRTAKFYEYQEAGVREYWLIDPRRGKERVDFWVLDAAGSYQPIPIDQDGTYRSKVLPGFWLNVGWLLASEPPDAFLTFARIVGPEVLATRLNALRDV